MSATPLSNPRFFARYPGTDEPLAGGLVYTYAAGTTEMKLSYADAQMETANTNPVVLDADGGASIYLDGAYKIVVRTPVGALVQSQDYVEGGDTGRAGDAALGPEVVFTTGQTIGVELANRIVIANRPSSMTFDFVSAADLGSSFLLLIKNIGSGSVVLNPYQDETLDGASTKELRSGESILFSSNGQNLRELLFSSRNSKRAYIGQVFQLTGTAAPIGTLAANGQQVSRADWPTLWAFVGTSGNLAATEGGKFRGQYGPGDGLTTFTVPNLSADNGYFLRSTSSGRVIGTVQTDAFAEHDHTITIEPDGDHIHQVPIQNVGGAQTGGAGDRMVPGGATPTSEEGEHTHDATSGTAGSGTETRPKNVAYPFFIQAE